MPSRRSFSPARLPAALGRVATTLEFALVCAAVAMGGLSALWSLGRMSAAWLG